MASTRELWILLRARDEASRVVHSFSKNVRAAALSAQAAQKSAEAAAIRQQAQMLKANGATARQIRAINDHVVSLEKQARVQTLAAAKAREFRAEQMKSIDAQVRQNNQHAAGLERQARALTLAATMADEHRTSLIRLNGATNEATQAIDSQIGALRKRAATLNAEAAVSRGASASLIAGLQKEQTGLDGSIRSYERRAAAIRAQAAIMRNQAAALKVNMDSQVRALTNQAAALDRQANSFRQAANAARKHDIQMKKTIEGLGKVSEASTVAAFTLGAVGVGGLIGLKQAINTTVDYERQTRATMTQVGDFKVSLEELGAVGKRIANKIAVPFEQIQPALFDIFSSMDVNVKDAEKLLAAFSKAAVAGQTDIQAVSRATIGILNAFHRPASDVNKVLDIQFQLVKLGIGTYEEWNQRIGLVTPSAVRAGQSIEMMAAALATSTRMGISAARSGTAVSRAMDAISHPAAVKNMEQLGIKVRDAHGKFRPMNKILREFRDVLMKMPEKDRVKAILDVFKGAGGTIEARRFLQNILLGKGNLEQFDSILARVQKSSGSMEEAYKTMADSTAAKTELLRNKWQLLKEAIGKALLPQFDGLITKMSQLLDWFNKLPSGTKQTIAQFFLWGSVIGIVLGGLFAFIAIAAVVAAAFATMGGAAALTLGVITLIPLALVAIGAAFIAAYKNSESFRNAVKQVGDNLKQLWDIAVQTAQNIKNSFEQHLGPPIDKIAGIVKNKLLPAFREIMAMIDNEVIPKIREAGRIISDLADKAFSHMADVINSRVIPVINMMIGWWDKHKQQLQPVLQIIGQVVKWLLIIAAVIVGVVVAAIVGTLLVAWGLFIGIIAIVVMWIMTVVDWFKKLPEKISAVGSAISGFASSVGQFFTNLWNTITNFFTGVFNWFGQLPGRIGSFLSSLPSVINNAFVAALNAAAYAIGYGLGNVYKFFTQIVPKVGAFLAALPGKVASFFSDAWLKATIATSNGVSATVKWFRDLPGRAASAVSRLWSSIKAHYEAAKQGAVSSVKSMATSVETWARSIPGKVKSALSGIKSSVLSAWNGAKTWLIQAGRDIVQGAIDGIKSAGSGAVDFVKGLGHSLVKGFKDSVGVKSPSVKFRDIGFNVVRGLINGLTGSRKALQNALAKISHDVMSSLQAGKASKSLKASWAKRLSSTSKQLLALEAKRTAITNRLAAAQKSLNDQLKARADLMNSIKDKLSEAADITSIEDVQSPQDFKKALQDRLNQLAEFKKNLDTLRKNGLNTQTIVDLAQAGLDKADLVAMLAKASPAELQDINTLQKQIRDIAGSTGDQVAGAMYDAGIKAAQGLVNGLKSQQAAITKQMEAIANSLIKAIKKALGIKSPSRVFMGIGQNTALGYIQGYAQQMRKSSMDGEILNMGIRTAKATSSSGSQSGSGASRTTTQHITIHTNEIDPRRHAAELGWELERRLP